ncbi:MAG: hypothetical protein ABSG46_08145 [Candidatus Binataceae bacterium]|jgi:hypothetical protein
MNMDKSGDDFDTGAPDIAIGVAARLLGIVAAMAARQNDAPAVADCAALRGAVDRWLSRQSSEPTPEAG